MSPYKDKKVAIIGLSVEGVDTAAFFAKEQAVLTFCDRRTKESLGKTYTTLAALSSRFQLGDAYVSRLDGFDLIVRTPGMSLRTPQLQSAAAKGIPIESQTTLFFKHCQAPIIGVTGTKGKGTTSTLIHTILRASGRNSWLGGNVGTPLLSRVREIAPSDIVVLELSSFQLEDLTRSPHVAVVLKVTQEHLANFDPLATNYHTSREAYVEAKKSIVRHQKNHDMVVCNADDPTSVSFSKETRGKAYYFSRSQSSADSFVNDRAVYVKWNNGVHLICRLSDIHLLGMHNLENIASAALVGVLMGAPIESIRGAVRTFKGLEHRLEYVRTVSGVAYYDDSFSTVPETTIAAIESFTVPLVLIAGGSEKGSDYSGLGKKIAASDTKALVVVGQMAQRIAKAATDAGYTGEIVRGLQSMEEIVSVCAQKAKHGDAVLLSPACASFDMFTNYKERGSLFKQEVLRLS